MKYADRAKCVIDEIAALPGERPSATNPDVLRDLVNEVIATAKYDWAVIDANLFPDGKPLALDLKDPTLAAAWKAIRHDQRSLVEHAVVNEFLPAPDRHERYYDYDKDGFTFRVDRMSLAQKDGIRVSGKQAARIVLKYFPDCFQLVGKDLHFGWHSGQWVDTSTEIGYLISWNRDRFSDYMMNYLARRHPVTNADFPQKVSAAMADVMSADWIKGLAKQRKQWRESVAFRTQPVKPDTKVALAEFLQRRLDKARLRLDHSTALDQFNALQILGQRAKNAKTGRTWGIELEITDAGAIAWDEPGGWVRERDGSLRQQIGDGRMYEPWEFVSPILDTTFNDGLWMVCDQAKNTVKYYKAGVHVHVSATSRPRKVYDPRTKRSHTVPGARMTTSQVSRLIELYATVSPLLDPIIQRTKTREFCIPTKVDQWAAGWFEAPTSKKPHRVRPLRTREEDAIENARIWAQITKGPNHDQEPTEWKRHQELNLQALNKYGTIEFRSMGAIYDYEYLTRWAWLCRAMVDYAQSDEPIGAVYSVTDFNSLVALLHRASQEPIVKAARRAA